MKRRIIIYLLLALLICNTYGCGNQEPDKEVPSDQAPEEEEKVFEPKEEILHAELDSGMIQIGDVIVSLPLQVSVLIEQTNAEYLSIDYKPNIMDNDFLLSEDDGAVIAGLYFEDADCSAVYYSNGVENGVSQAGDLYVLELREIVSEHIFLPKGIQVGMTLTELQELFGETLEVGYTGDKEMIEYQVKFLIENENTVNRCVEYYETLEDYDCSHGFYGILYMDINRDTSILQEIRYYLGENALYY